MARIRNRAMARVSSMGVANVRAWTVASLRHMGMAMVRVKAIIITEGATLSIYKNMTSIRASYIYKHMQYASHIRASYIQEHDQHQSQLYIQAPEKINKTTTSQIMPLATFVPSLGRCGQGD